MTYTILDRLVILNTLLKKEGTREEMIIRRSIREKIEFTPEELELHTDKKAQLNIEDKETVFEYKFNTIEKGFLRDQLVELTKEKKFTEAHIDLYDFFVK